MTSTILGFGVRIKEGPKEGRYLPMDRVKIGCCFRGTHDEGLQKRKDCFSFEESLVRKKKTGKPERVKGGRIIMYLHSFTSTVGRRYFDILTPFRGFNTLLFRFLSFWTQGLPSRWRSKTKHVLFIEDKQTLRD